VSGACFADFGHDVRCLDTDPARIHELSQLRVPFYEPGLGELVERHARTGRLRFTTSVAEAVEGAQVVFLAVGTPQAPGGEADLSQIIDAVRMVAPCLNGRCVLATKSTVPVGTGMLLKRVLATLSLTGATVDVVSNPEFLREGSAISDFMRPDRVVIGADSPAAAALLREIYRPLYLLETPIVTTTIETAEMIKYASNAFLAVKIGFINEVANLCDRTHSDVHVVAKAMGLDKRIGPKFLHPGPGYGGSCFPKDTRALAALGVQHGVSMAIVEAAIRTNEEQRRLALEKIVAHAGGVAGRTVACLGIAFKPNTSDIRESPAWYLCTELVGRGARVRAFDPVAMREAKAAWQGDPRLLEFADDAYAAAEAADVLVVATEWNEFRNLDIERLGRVMTGRVIVDLRNVLEPERVRDAGFTYVSTGRGVQAATRHSGVVHHESV
jgi:UDPglucose 6-dehydrogenase